MKWRLLGFCRIWLGVGWRLVWWLRLMRGLLERRVNGGGGLEG